MTQTSSLNLDLAALQRALDDVMASERPALQRQLARLRRRAERGQPFDRGLARLNTALDEARARVLERERRLPTISYPPELPVSERRADIAAAIAKHQVVVICGETGSGKSTQLPKICLEVGRGRTGMIAHTQPRRIAARTLAARIAQELGSEIGEDVGYKIRFTDRVSPESYIKLVTDGMLLAEIQGDRDLLGYDTIIIDEAHERSLNIDFLLGYLKELLPRRPDLKVIVTSATIDPERFARHFDDAPVLQVSGRTYPVEVRYRPLVEDEAEHDLRTGVLKAVEELTREGPGDMLVFLAGERDIRDVAEALRRHQPPSTEVLPLYARLSAAEQARIFQPSGARRRIVLATNVAETSVTVPGIRYVIDAGQARIGRYSYRTKVHRLPIEPIAQASADQRAGRCGRTGPGICIRLYSEEDYQSRPRFTEPEIQRTNLASVILQMKGLGLGEIEAFPFVEPPDQRFINDGFKLLHELGAVDTARELTALGRRLARLPVDPRVGRMLLAAEREGCLREVLVIAAALSVQDPRERPMEAQQAADQAHAEWRDKRSDFVTYLNLWKEFEARRAELGRRRLAGWCRERFLSFRRMYEWQDIHRQLIGLVKGMRAKVNDVEAEYEPLHRALLTGLLSNIGLKTERGDYQAPRNVKVQIHPGSGLARKKPKWIMAAEFVETQRYYARDVAETRPEWVEAAAQHLVTRSYSEPHWQGRRGRVAAFETVSLYGLVLTARRRVNYAAIDPVEARAIFLREGLARGGFRSRGAFQRHNEKLIAGIEELEAKARRRDVLADEDALVAFYDQRVPPEVTSGPDFEQWRQRAERDAPKLLYMTRDDLMQREPEEVGAGEFPDYLEVRGARLPLEYQFEPGDERDGVTAKVPLPLLNQLPPERFEWLVGGLLHEKVVALIRALPKALRRNFVPAPDFANAALERMTLGEGSLLEALRRELQGMTGVEISLDAWDDIALPSHLQFRFEVLDAKGQVLAQGRSLAELQSRLHGDASRAFDSVPDTEGADEAAAWQRDGLRRWDFDALPETVAQEQHGVQFQGYPALIDRGDSVSLRLLDAPERAQHETLAGVRRLFMLELNQQTKYLRRNLPGLDKMCLQFGPIGSCEALREDIIAAVFDQCFMPDGVAPRTRDAFRERLEQGRGELVTTAQSLCETLAPAMDAFHAVRKKLKRPATLAQAESLKDCREQLEALVYVGFVLETPPAWRIHLPRYLQALERRLDKLAADPGRDRNGLRAVRPWWERYCERRALHDKKRIKDPALMEFRWLIEEYRVSVFAQELKTAVPVSDKRLQRAWKEVR